MLQMISSLAILSQPCVQRGEVSGLVRKLERLLSRQDLITTHKRDESNDFIDDSFGQIFVADKFLYGWPAPTYTFRPATRQDPLSQIVAIGVDAIPQLLRHLDDTAPVGGPLDTTMFSGVFVVPIRYDGRYLKSRLPWINRTDSDGSPGSAVEHSVRLTVGDVAAFALGQIVNRWYLPAFYSNHQLLLSDFSGNPKFCKRARSDWKNLTASEHRKMLAEDLLYPDCNLRRVMALSRIQRYYPQDLERLLILCLRGYRDIPESDLNWKPQFFETLSSCGSPRIDKECVELLNRMRMDSDRSTHFKFSGFPLVSYLTRRGRYIKSCREYAAFIVGSGDPNAGRFARYLKW